MSTDVQMHTSRRSTKASSVAARAMKQEAEGARLVLSDLANLAVMHPDWTARLDAVDRSSVMLGPLLELLQSAPNEFAKGMLFGQLHMKAQEISNEISRTIGCRD